MMFCLRTLSVVALSLAATSQLVGAVEWPGPKPTGNQLLIDEVGWTPLPTSPPMIRGRMAGAELFEKRTEAPRVLCGYVDGIQESTVTCSDFRDSCFFNTLIQAVGCCRSANDPPSKCHQYTSCVDYSAIGSCTGSCATDTLIVKCSSESQYCFTYEFTLGYRALGCTTSSFSSYLELTYNGQPSQTESPSPTSTSSSSISTIISKPNNVNTGAIVGGAVGGLAIIAGFILALVFLLRRKKKHAAEAAAAQTAANNAAAGGIYDPNVPLSPAPQYNHMSGYYDASATMKPEYAQGGPEQYPSGQYPGQYDPKIASVPVEEAHELPGPIYEVAGN